jgi:ribosomal-protein-alanine N-acetyltransferase
MSTSCIRVIEAPATTNIFLKGAELDRRAWGSGPGSEFVPDGEHAWRLWSEYSYVAVALSSDDEIAGVLLAFDTSTGEHFAHKLFVSEDLRKAGIGHLLLTHYCAYLDKKQLSSVFSTSPSNTAMLHLSSKFDFVRDSLIPNYYGPGKDRVLRRRAAKPI